MDLTKWEPRGIAPFRHEIERLFDSFVGREPTVRTNGDWSPALDEIETAEEIVVKAELPGMEEKNISVSLSGNNLIIQGERKAEEKKKDTHFHRTERSYGKFERMLSLPVSVDPKKISADYAKGVLEVHLPKKAEARPKRIKIGSSK